MRQFSMIPHDFWSNCMGKKLKKLSRDTRLLAIYLNSCQHITMLGVYYLPMEYAAFDLNMTTDEIMVSLHELEQIDFCRYDVEHNTIWVCDYADFHVGSLDRDDNRVKHIQKNVSSWLNYEFLDEFYTRYGDVLYLTHNKGLRSPLQAPPKHIDIDINIDLDRDIDVDVDRDLNQIEIKNKKINKKSPTALSPDGDVDECVDSEIQASKDAMVLIPDKKSTINQVVRDIFACWQKECKKETAKLDDKRKHTIERALKLGYSKEQLCQAIRGCTLSSYHQGHNDRGKVYDELTLILRDAAHIESFLANVDCSPMGITTSYARSSYSSSFINDPTIGAV